MCTYFFKILHAFWIFLCNNQGKKLENFLLCSILKWFLSFAIKKKKKLKYVFCITNHIQQALHSNILKNG